MARAKQKSGRNRNGVGSVRKIRENLYQGTIQLAPKDRRYVSGHTKEEAEQKLAELRVLYQQGRLLARSRETVRDYLQAWLRDDVKPAVAPRTFENYELNVRRLEPLIGSIRLDALKPDHIKTAYRSLLDGGLSARSVQQAHRTLRAALRQAVKPEHLYRDPTFGVTPPRAPEREEVVLTAGQIRTLLASTEDHYLHPLWVVLATTGMRVGEALGLQWRDVDLDAGMVTIRRQAQWQKGPGMVLSEVKTKASHRTLPLVPGTIAVLRKQRAAAMERHLAVGMPWNDAMQVFATIDGNLINPGTVSKAFHRALDGAHLPQMRVHDLRHTVSSFIQSRGRTEREAQEVMGHASPATTRHIYTHVMPDRRRDIITPVEEFFPSEDGA
jgi:integrase